MKNTAFAALLLFALTGCGGGGGAANALPAGEFDAGSPVPPPSLNKRVVIERVAGPVGERQDFVANPSRGCVDGDLDQVLFGSQMTLAVTADDATIFTSELGACDGRYRIRKVDLRANKVSTIVVGGALGVGQVSAFPDLFMTPTGIDVAEGGELLIADSDSFTGGLTLTNRDRPGFGYGVWSLVNSTTATRAAGFDAAAGAAPVDGRGGAAVFARLNAVCAGTGGQIYVSDVSGLRLIDAKGNVSTPTFDGTSKFQGLACGRTQGDLTTVVQDGRRKVYDLQRSLAFNPLLESNLVLLARLNDDFVWTYDSTLKSVILRRLTDGSVAPDSSISVENGAIINGVRYTPVVTSLRAGDGGVSYMATEYSILRISYK